MKYFFYKISLLLSFFLIFLCSTIPPKSDSRIVQLCGSGDFLITEKRKIIEGSPIFILQEKINLNNKTLNELHTSQKNDDKRNINSLHEKIDLLHLEIVTIYSEEGDQRFKSRYFYSPESSSSNFGFRLIRNLD